MNVTSKMTSGGRNCLILVLLICNFVIALLFNCHFALVFQMANNIYNKRNSGFNNNAILQLTNNADYNHEQSFPPTGALQVAGGASIQKNLYVGG